MDASALFIECMEWLDVGLTRRLWQAAFPHLPPLEDDESIVTMLHLARTRSNSIDIRNRAYSHRWLMERGHTSLLPDDLRPQAERIYPRIVTGVGIGTVIGSTTSQARLEFGQEVRTQMENAVLDAYAEGRTDPEYVRGRMEDARQKAWRRW